MKSSLGGCCFKWMLWGLAGLILFSGNVAAAQRMAVKTKVANLRSGPGVKYKVMWQVEKYNPFVIVEKRKDWYMVKDFEGDLAWIHQSLLGNIKTVITIKTKCNVRSRPDKESAVLFTVERGVPFKVLKRKGNWIRIEHADGEVGWIFKRLVW